MKLEEEKLEAQLQYAKYEHETEVLRERKLFNCIKIPSFNSFMLFSITHTQILSGIFLEVATVSIFEIG